MKTLTKKVLSSVLAVAAVATMGINAFAADVTTAGGDGKSDVLLTAEGATFSVTVPMNLSVSVDADGEVTVANDVKIINNSHGQVQVTNVTIAGANDWATVDYATDMTKEKVGAKKIGFLINNDTTTGADAISFTQDNFPVMDGKNDSDSDELPITYNAKLPAQKTAINGDKVADVTFTIGWYETDGSASIA